jgi:pimeloyl-ACP methyl ester carboxylesterase
MLRRSALFALWIASAAALQVHKPGPQVLTFLSDVDDTDQPYGLYLPKSYSSARKYPLLISLHGAGSNHRLNLRRVLGRGNRPGESDAEASRYWPPLKDVEFVIATPFARGTMGYQGIPEKDVLDVLADVKNRFSIDEDRVYLTGLSMGGGGTLWIGLTRPDLWAAIVPVCPAAPPGTIDLAPNALNVPVKIFQGALDPVVKADDVRRFHAALVDAGVASEYVEFPNVRHNAWDPAYRDGAVFEWFAKHRRVRHPQRVSFRARDYSHASAYWVRIDKLTPGTPADIDAHFEGRNKLVIKTANTGGFTLQLRGHPFASAGLTITVDGTAFRVKSSDSIPFARAGKTWKLQRATFTAGEKQPGAEGPIADAIATRHIYVYGASDSPPPEELQRRKQIATEAAEWSTPRSRLLLTFRVASDTELKEPDLKSANLVLFGSAHTNSLIARYAPRLPLSLNPGAADYGLVYVYPMDGRYVVISSGLPWWTRLDQARRPGLPFIAAPYRALQSFEDYILFRGGLENVLAEGRFDSHWKLPAAAAERLRSTGAVEIQ